MQGLRDAAWYSARPSLTSSAQIDNGAHLNRLVDKPLVLFGQALQPKRIGQHSETALHSSYDIGATKPVRFVQIRRGPLRRMIRVRVIKADNIQALRPPSRWMRISSTGAM